MSEMDAKLLARRIDAYCAETGIEKTAFSKATGISLASLSQWRKGVYKPSDKAIAAVEEFTGMKIDALMGKRVYGGQYLVEPDISDDNVSFPVIGGVAAGYGHIAYEDWTGDSIDIPRSYLHGCEPKDYFVLRVEGDSMYPDYQDGDHVLVLRQSTMDRSGQVGVVVYGDENATLKRIEYVPGEDWMKLCPINPQYPPITIRNEALTHCVVLGVAKLVVREVDKQ